MGYLRPEIEIFARKMETEMRKNDDEKGDSYKTCDLRFLIDKVNEERNEVNILLTPFHFADKGIDKEKAVKELIDEANLCMMVAYRILEVTE